MLLMKDEWPTNQKNEHILQNNIDDLIDTEDNRYFHMKNVKNDIFAGSIREKGAHTIVEL